VGETTLTFSRDGRGFYFEGLVIRDLDVEILASIPFMETNDVAIRPAKHQVFCHMIAMLLNKTVNE
jgi:hypothetical protein